MVLFAALTTQAEAAPSVLLRMQCELQQRKTVMFLVGFTGLT